MLESVSGLQRVIERSFDIERTVGLHFVSQVYAFDELKDDEVDALVLADIIGASDIGVVEAGSALCFDAETANRLFITLIARQNFDGDNAPQPCVGGPIDRSHATATHKRSQLVMFQTRAGE